MEAVNIDFDSLTQPGNETESLVLVGDASSIRSLVNYF